MASLVRCLEVADGHPRDIAGVEVVLELVEDQRLVALGTEQQG